MTHKKPQPLIEPRPRKLCPVCGETSYSLMGVHPQCAANQADVNRVNGTSHTEKSTDTETSDSHQKAWHKPCPVCRKLNHVRKSVCECGHELVPPTTKSETEDDNWQV